MKIHRFHIIILGTCLVLLLTRLSGLSVFPAALTHDEMVYAVQAKSFAVQGTTLNQKYRPWSLQPAHPMYAELPAVLLAPFAMISNPLIATRALTVVMGICFPFILAWLAYGIWHNRRLSLIVLLIAAVNPLLWQMSRLTYDAVLSTFFYLLGGAILLNVTGKKSWWGIPVFTAGFFQYQGYKLLFIPWMLLLAAILYLREPELRRSKTRIAVFGAALVLFCLYLVAIMPHQAVENRFKQTIFADNTYQTSVTNDERRLTLENPLSRIVSNKYSTIARFMIVRAVGAFSPGLLFLDGEPAQSKFAVWSYGWFHVIDFALLLLGVAYVARKRPARIPALLIGGFIIFCTAPSMINAGNSWYLLRMFLPNLLLLFFAAWGALWISQSRWGKIGLVSLYLLSAGLFAYHYYYRYPVLGLNTSYLSERVMAEYAARLHRQQPDRKIAVYTVDPPVMYWTYLMYAHRITPETVAAIAEAENSGRYEIDNIEFTGTCVDAARDDAVVLAEAWRGLCDESQTSYTKSDYAGRVTAQQDNAITIPSVVDNGAYWRVYNDGLCTGVGLPGYITVTRLNDLKISSQDNDSFCRHWFTNVH